MSRPAVDAPRRAELVLELLPAARQGLVRAGGGGRGRPPARGDRGRVATGQTGAVWQRRALAALEPRLGRERALAATLERYLDYAATDQPVHSWPTGRS